MSSSASASAYWRVAGMSYLKYSGLCADMVRAALKEPVRTKAKTREVVFFRRAEWKDGQPQKQGKKQAEQLLATSSAKLAAVALTVPLTFDLLVFKTLSHHVSSVHCSHHGLFAGRGAGEGMISSLNTHLSCQLLSAIVSSTSLRGRVGLLARAGKRTWCEMTGVRTRMCRTSY